MEINLGKSFGSNMGVTTGTAGEGVAGARHLAGDASHGTRSVSNLTIGEGIAALSSAEPTADVPDAALRRDDDLGNLVNAVFNLPPPPMPNFGD